MSHLGDLLSAHVDGELDGAEQDKVSVHLARCEQCREEAAQLRALKRQIGELAAHVPGEPDMTQRLLEIAEVAAVIGASTPARKHRVLSRPSRALAGRGPTAPGPAGPRRSRAPKLSPKLNPKLSPKPILKRMSRRRKYAVLGAVSIVVSLGTAAFSVGGSDAGPGRTIVPQVELFSEEHAITTGGVPFEGPGPVLEMSTSSTARQP
jgi:anti-sigma factor RsiW